MRRLAAGAAAGLVLAVVPAAAASAHPSETSAVLARVGDDEVALELQVPLDRYDLATDSSVEATEESVAAAAGDIEEYVEAHVALSDEDGDYAVEVTAVTLETVNDLPTLVVDVAATPAGGSVGDVVLEYDVVSERIATHDVYVSLVSDWDSGVLASEETDPQLLGVLTTDETSIDLRGADASWWSGLRATVALGMRHIADGTDHLLFLAMLLVVAPLAAVGRGARARWRERRTVGATLRRAGLVASAFTVGHSLTLAAVSLGWLHVPTKPVEVLVAVSIGVAAMHAVRPVLRRGEVWIAGVFGLVHGAAFATTILDLGLDRSSTLSAILGFNLGVELAQLVAICVVLPFLLLLSRSRAYGVVRVGLALVALVAATAWAVGVLTGTDSALQPAFDAVAVHPWAALVIFGGSAIALWALVPARPRVGAWPSTSPSPTR